MNDISGKNRIRFITMILSIILIIISLYTPIKIYADYNGGEGTGNSGNVSTLEGGASTNKTAILFYIVKKDTGKALSGIGLITANAEALSIAKERRLTQSKLGRLLYNNSVVATDLPAPVKWNGKQWESNGNAVREWLLEQGSTMQRYEFLVKSLWGEAILKELQVHKSQYSIVVEPVAWMYVYVMNKGIYLEKAGANMGTADGWANYYNKVGQPTGDAYTWKMTHAALPYSMVLETERFDLGAHAGESMRRLRGDEVVNSGYGIHIIDLSGSSSSTSTYDDPLGTTIAPAPDPSSLPPETSDYPTTSKQVTIIKNYVTREESIGTEVVDGNFIRQQNPHIIDIEDEPEYTVVQWETSTHLPPPSIQNGSTLETYDDLTVSSDSIQSGSSSENAVTLTDKEFILYVKLIFNL